MPDSKNLQIRNSTIDFLTFTRQAGEDGVEVRVQDNDVWLTQASIAKLFGVERSVVTKHLKNVFADKEIDENSVCANFAQTADDGKTYNYKFYGLKAVIAVGYKVNSQAAVEFRQWATRVLDAFANALSLFNFLFLLYYSITGGIYERDIKSFRKSSQLS